MFNILNLNFMNSRKKIFLLVIMFFSANFIFAQKSIDDAKKLTISEQFSTAEDAYKSLISTTPTNGDNYYFYGDSEIKAFFSDTITRSLTETYDKCKTIFENGTKNDAANLLNYIGLARIEYLNGNKTKATEYINKVNTTLLPFAELKIKKVEKMTDIKRYALQLNEMAKIYIIANNTDTTAALPLLRRAKLADPTNAEICITMGDAYLNVKDVNAAIENYNAAQTLDAKSPLAKLRIGYLYVRAKNLTVAIPYFEDAIEIDPNFAPAYKELGYLYSLAGMQEKSKNNYQKYLELSGDNIPAKISYVVTLFKSTDYATCITIINQIFAVDSTINSMNRVIAYCLYEESIKKTATVKEYTKAQYYIEKFFKNTTPDKIINKDYIYYGKILGEREKADLAEENLRKALVADPTLTELFSDIAKYQRTAKNYPRVEVALEEKIKANAATIEDYYNLGKAYYFDNKFEQSDKTFDNVLALEFGKYKNYKILCLSYQGYARMKIDTSYVTGYAKPVYEKLIEEAKLDSTKNTKYLVEGYSYLASYYLLNETEKDFIKSKRLYNQVLAIEPKNVFANAALKTVELSKVKLPEEEDKK